MRPSRRSSTAAMTSIPSLRSTCWPASPASTKSGDKRGHNGATTTATTPSTSSSALEPRAPSTPAVLKLRRALDKQLRHAGRGVGALVYDLDTGKQLYAAKAGVGRPPASVEKLYTTVA